MRPIQPSSSQRTHMTRFSSSMPLRKWPLVARPVRDLAGDPTGAPARAMRQNLARCSRRTRAIGLVRSIALGGALAFALAGPSHADDSEIFIAQSTTSPNIMLILDTSGSMDGQVTTQEPYDPARDYTAEGTGSCAGLAGRVYYKTGSNQGTPPSCNSDTYVSSSNLRCALAVAALASNAGRYQGDRLIQWRSNNSGTRAWRTLSSGTDMPIECKNDNGTDGDLTSSNPYPDRTASSSNNTPRWTASANNSYWRNNPDGGTSATLYSANYVVYHNQFRTNRLGTRLEVMQQAARELLNSISNVNVGLMRYSTNTQSNDADGGGMVLWPISPIEESRDALINLIDNFVANGNTPLSETLYEAHQYFTGGEVYYGNTSRACVANTSGGCTMRSVKSVASSRLGGQEDDSHYRSPAGDACQKNFIVYLTDGEPTSDTGADSRITNLRDFGKLSGGCSSSGQGRCLGALAQYMFKKDLRDDVSGEQNVATHFIGFGDTFGGTSNSAFQYLKDAGERGGGDAYQAGDLSELTMVFNTIFGAILDQSTTLTAPTVAVNAFNRTQTLSDLYVSVFQPQAGRHWHGNLKKYGIDSDGTIVDRSDQPAVNTTSGFFRDTTSDIWSKTNADGAAVRRGGAANQIPSPAERKLYTYIGANPAAAVDLTADAYALHRDNTAITNAVLGIDGTSDPLREKLIDWARGSDVNDEDIDGVTDEARFIMGDPMHAQPGIVVYDGEIDESSGEPVQIFDAVVFSATNDGYLHAIDADDGTELWAFVPQELLPGLEPLYHNQNTATKSYGLDEDVQVLKYDVNGDGIVDPDANDRVLLYFSTGRNASVSRYYALDVTRKNAPRFLWSLGPSELPGLGQAWSPPAITRVNVAGKTQNSQKLVLVFGGGYDPAEEAGPYIDSSSVGNRLFIVDALKGTLLWSAGKSNADLELARMEHSIPSGVAVMDMDGDGYADRMYVGDMAAQLWRFDIYNGQNAASLVTGGVMASLGARDAATRTAANTRRFYNAPDVAALQTGNAMGFLNIAIGSGYRGHPLNTATHEAFYSIRDKRPLAKLTQAEYDAMTILEEDDLVDVTTDVTPTMPTGANGWRMDLNQPNGVWRGEKSLSASRTFQNTVFFTTYTPSPSATSNACTLAVGSNRVYAVSAFDGSPRKQRDGEADPDGSDGGGDGSPSPEDRYDELYQGGIAPEVTFLFPEKDQVVCLSGVEVLGACRNFNSRIKTYWREFTAN